MNSFALRFRNNAPFVPLIEASLPAEVVEVAERQYSRMKFNLETLLNSYAVSRHTIEVDFRSNLTFNASCSSQVYGDRVSLNTGIYVWSYIISCLIDASTHDETIREGYAASSFMLDVREYERTDGDVLKSILKEYSAFFTTSNRIGKVLSSITDCIWPHEVAHSLLGHAEYVAKSHGRMGTSLQERPESGSRRLFPPAYVEDRRFMEWEADRFAGVLAALFMAERGDASGQEVEDELALLLYGYAILVSAFQTANESTPNAMLYPSPLFRFLSFQSGMTVKGSQVGVETRQLFTEGTLTRSVRLCFQMLSEQGGYFQP